MSVKPFENFLVELFIASDETLIKPGFRYQFKSPDSDNSLKLLKALLEKKQGFIKTSNGVNLPYLQLPHCKIIVVVHSEHLELTEGFTENYISNLRDEVSKLSGNMRECALLVIHNSLLDTLINSAKDLAQDDQIWSLKKIYEAMRGLINDQDVNRHVSLCLLKDQFDSILEDGATMFGFEALYNAVQDGHLCFEELGMFEDPLILEMIGNEEQIKTRLEQNRKLYDEISREVEYYSDQLSDRLTTLGEKFIEKHFSTPDAWKDVEYEEFVQERKRNSTQKLVLIEDQVSAGATLTSRHRSESKAGMRDCHLIIELDEGINVFELKLIFQDANNLEKSQFKIQPTHALNKQEIITTRNNLKNATVTLEGHYKHEPIFFNLALKRINKAEAYNFRCLIVRKGAFYIEAFKNVFLIENMKKRLTLKTQENKLHIRNGEGAICVLSDCKQTISCDMFSLVDFNDFANESDEITFCLKSGEDQLCFNIEGAPASESLDLPLLLNCSRYHKLFNDDYNGEFNAFKGKVDLDNTEFLVTGLRHKLMRFEADFVAERIVAKFDDKTLTLDDLISIDDAIYAGYKALFSYLGERNTIPSLVSWGGEFTHIVECIVCAFLTYFSGIPAGEVLNVQQKNVLKIGLIKTEEDEYYSPFHPLILSYYLNLKNAIMEDSSFVNLPDVTLERLSPKGLLPFVYHPQFEFAYNQQVKENAFWIKSVHQEKSTLLFVRKLVKEKIEEFQTAFKPLFQGTQKSLILNAVNQDGATQLFLGVVDYVKKNLDKSPSIHVNFYDDVLSINAFDEFSEMASYDTLKEKLELNKGKARELADSVIDILRTRLSYSKFTNKEARKNGQAYAHLTFFRNNNKVEAQDIFIDNMCSGIACGGLLAGEASESQSGSYFTSFGLKGVDYESSLHLKMAKFLGSLIKPALKPNTQYHGSNAIALAVSDDFKQQLTLSYESSIWTTIIDPKVTLDFFHSNDDVILIHYSDQYTSSSSYDAITVTSQCDLFEKILKQGDGGQLNEFNAFNGDWLLKMMICDKTIKKERQAIIGAYKFVTALLYPSDIIWVPLSVAEMIRVSGNVGLKMSESDFSRNVQGYKKGAISDDVLFVGFKDQHMYLLPLEVKTGGRPNITKAVKQAQELLRYLSEDLLGTDTFASKLYRGLFMRQVLMQIDKYRLYKVFDSCYFDTLLSEKEQWLTGDYKLAKVANYPDGFVLTHLDCPSCTEPDHQMIDGILKIELPISLLPSLVENPLQVLLNSIDIVKICHVPTHYILGENTQPEKINTNNMHESGRNAQSDTLEFESLNKILNEEIIKEEALNKEARTVEINDVNPSDNNLTVLFGHNATTQAPLNWEPTNTAKFMNTNTGIIGTMGTGKTQFTKSVITQLHRNQIDNLNGASIGVLIFDYKSDYVDDKFQQATSGKKFKLHKLPYNPLSLFGDTPMLPVHTARGFSETMGKAFNLGQRQQLRLRRLLGEAYEASGISKSDPATWNKPAPTIADIWLLFLETKPDEDSLYAALESLCELEIFEENNKKCKSLYELVDGVTVIDLAGYPSEIQNLVVALTLDLFYTQMQKNGKPKIQGHFRQITKMILVDEADNFMSQNFPSLRKILKEGREYGVGMILSTQDITHFQTAGNDYSSYILTWVIHRVAKIKTQDIKAIFSVNEKAEQERLMENINKLEKHYSFYIDGAKKIVKMRDRAFWELSL